MAILNINRMVSIDVMSDRNSRKVADGSESVLTSPYTVGNRSTDFRTLKLEHGC